MEKSITMTTFTDETLREEFISKYRYTDQFTFVLLNESDDSRKANAEAIADYWLSKFHSYQAYLIEQGEGMKVIIKAHQDSPSMIGQHMRNQAIEEYQKVIRGE